MSKTDGWQACRAHSCDRFVHPQRVFCRRHWSLLPDYLQQEIGAAVLKLPKPDKVRLRELLERAILGLEVLERKRREKA